jgi:hypothetical protein
MTLALRGFASARSRSGLAHSSFRPSSTRARCQPAAPLSAGHPGDDAYLTCARDRRLESTTFPMVRAVDIEIEMLNQRPLLIEEQVRDGEGAQRIAQGLGFNLETLATVRLCGEQARNDYRDQCWHLDGEYRGW